jgi:hypothetical protein
MTGEVTLKPRKWAGFFDGWEVWAGPDYMGLIGQYDGPVSSIRYRAYGTGPSLDSDPVPTEAEFASLNEAVAWLVGAES